jgi:large conductance mechanosensitive channel
MFKEFRDFALKGNVIDLAVGVIIGSAFTTIVNSLVDDIIMPPIGALLGGVDFKDFFWLIETGDPVGPYPTLAEANEAGAVTINYGMFINHMVTFLIVALVLFLVVRSINRLKKQKEEQPAEPTTKDCRFCKTEIPLAATRCPHCTSELEQD